MKNLSYQLYSSRNHPPLANTCAMLAELGYKEVEGFGGVYEDIGATAELLSQHGLRMTSGHFGLQQLEDDAAACFEIAKKVGMETIFCPFLMPDERPADKAGWEELANTRLRAVLQKCKDEGFAFGWHNHDFEVVPLPDGSLPLDLILDCDPDLKWEADLAWIQRGNGDIASCVQRHGSKMAAVHIKDIAPEGECADEDGWADIGHGVMDWSALLTSLGNLPVRHYILEHDKPSDDRRFAQRSIEALRQYPALGE